MIMIPLGDLGDFSNGVNFNSQQMGRGIPLINVKDVTNSHRINITQLDLVDVKFNDEQIARTNDIFFVRSSVKLSGIALVSKLKSSEQSTLHCGFVIRFRPTSSSIDSDYLLYLLLSPEYREKLKNLSGGAAIINISQLNLKGLKVPVPSITIQKTISRILKAYDDLIENNARRIALLEESARLLYQEWFVHLRFPGYQNTRINNGVPDKWELKTLGDVCEEIRETVLPDLIEPNTPYIGLEHIPRRSISLSQWGQASQVTSSKHRFREGEIIFGKIRPYFHKVGVAFVDGIASSDAIIIRPKSNDFSGLVLMTVSSDEFIVVTAQQMREGSKMPRADWKQMQAYSLLIPPYDLLMTFEEIIKPIINQLKTLCFSNQNLSTARDLLLPRLMNGEISV